jgi:hypothetical protein
VRKLNKMLRVGCGAVMLTAVSLPAETLPSQLAGSWRITRILPTHNTACWNDEQAQPLVGSTLSYSRDAMQWRGGTVPVQGVVVRQVTEKEFRNENSGSSGGVDFLQLGIRTRQVMEVDLQHEDADITGATTEVPGDSILVAGPNRIIVSACGVFFEATRGGFTRASSHR